MSLDPGYGETPLPGDELQYLRPSVREILDDPVTKAAVYDLEQAVQVEVAEDLLAGVLDAALTLDELLTDAFVRDLHHRLYGDIWTWAGTFRRHEASIGVAPAMISVELRGGLENIAYRWGHTLDWSPRQLGIAVHAETVRIHPFTDGNGRTTRLLGDLVFAAAQDSETQELYDWELDKRRYIELLRDYDRHRDPTDLANFVGVRLLGE